MKQAHKRNQKRTATRRLQKGAVIIELAMMLPLLVTLFVVIIDLGLLLREHQVLHNAAREGARMSSLPRNQVGPQNPSATIGTLQQRVVDYLAEENISVALGSVSVDQNRQILVGGGAVNASEVTVTYARDPLIGFLTAGPVTLTAEAVFRNLY